MVTVEQRDWLYERAWCARQDAAELRFKAELRRFLSPDWEQQTGTTATTPSASPATPLHGRIIRELRGPT
jgi:hypothetical protein